jgi:glycosyltransferase involved in cell wall biosynthesis
VPDRPESPKRIVLAANSSWNIVNFRGGLVRALRKQGYEPVVVAPIDAAAETRMEQLGVERIPVELDRSGLNPIADLRLLWVYRAALRRLAPAAFLGFTIKPNIYGCLAAQMSGVPAIANVSGLGTVFMKQSLLTRFVSGMYRVALRRAKAVMFQNREDLELFVSSEIVRREQARLLPGSGVDCDRFAPEPLPSGRPRFLLIGRLLGDKGVREYVEAARHVRSRHPEAVFQLLGPIDEGNRTSIRPAELASWVAEGVVQHLGIADDVRPFIAAASAIVLPSYREGLPRSLLEGAAMGRPLIAADVPGSRDVIEHGLNGLLCEARSAGALEGAIEAFIAMPAAEQRAMGLAGRALVERRFGEHRVIEAYLEVIRSLEADSRPRSGPSRQGFDAP